MLLIYLLTVLFYLLAFAAVALAILHFFLRLPRFGLLPKNRRSEACRNSFHYTGGEFRNLSPTPNLKEGRSMIMIFWDFFFKPKPRHKPGKPLPSARTDLKALRPDADVLVWFGHSSYFMQVDGKRFLVDPVFSGSASPIPATTRSFAGSDIYMPEDMPEIDFLLLTHDHWDHLDYDTVLRLKNRVKTVVTGLGTGAHLERWGYEPERIIEKDWWSETDLGDGFLLAHTPARHFSGRGFKRNQSVWTSFVLKTPTKNLFLGGDSGYDAHFAEIGRKYGPFDLALLECGQYNDDWPYIHMLPGEWAKAAADLNAKAAMPVHWGKFALALHPWDEPAERFTDEMEGAGILSLTPMIGEKVDLDAMRPFGKWWREGGGKSQ